MYTNVIKDKFRKEKNIFDIILKLYSIERKQNLTNMLTKNALNL